MGPYTVSESLTVSPKIVSETFANEFSYVYFTENLFSPAFHKAFCCNLGSIVISYESVCKRLATRVHYGTRDYDLMVSTRNY